MFDKFQAVVDFIREYYGNPDGAIPLHAPIFRGNERNYVLDCIDSTFVSSVGAYVNKFEEMMCDYTGASYAIATVNGTAALHMSLLLAGVKENDFVITQPLTFIATCNAISYIGASPLFIDNDKQTLGMSVAKLTEFLKANTQLREGGCYHKLTGRRVAACVPMHTFGHPGYIDELVAVCHEFQIPMIEDAAESIGSKYKGRHTGTFGLIGSFSFNGNKTITCGGGGMIVTNNEKIGKLAKHLTTQAKVSHPWEFVHDHIGYNYRLPNLNAALACAQMEVLDDYIASKRSLATRYQELFRELNIHFLVEPKDTFSNYWLCSILLKDRRERDLFLEYTNGRKVQTRPAWALMNTLDMFKDCISGDLSTAEELENRLVCLPSSVKMT